MKTSESIDQLAKALAAAQGEIKNATLNKINPHFKSRYADLAEIRNMTIPHLSKHGIAVFQGTSMIDGHLFAVTRFIHLSGQWMQSEWPIAMDKPQIMGSAMTYGRRYNLAGGSAIAAEEDDDANAAQTSGNGADKPTYSKARSRDPFAKLDTALRSYSNLDELAIWWYEAKPDRERLDKDFHLELAFNYVAHGLAIAENLAALRAFYADAYKNVMPGMPIDKQDALVALKEGAKNRFVVSTLEAG